MSSRRRLSVGALALGVLVFSNVSAGAQSTTPVTAPAFNCASSFNPYKVADSILDRCGLKHFPLLAVTTRPDGGKEYVYLVENQRTTYRVPPPSFNGLRANPEQLDYYGFPPRPTSAAELAPWIAMMSNLHPVVPPRSLIEVKIKADATSSSWSGFVANSSCNSSCTFAEAYYNEPQYTGSCPHSDAAAIWAGIGGWNNGNLLGQDGTGYHFVAMSNHEAWYQTDPNGYAVAQPLFGNVGYGFIAKTQWVAGSGWHFYMYDYYTGNFVSPNVAASSADLSTADFIVERPTNNGVRQDLSDYYYTTFNDAWVNGTGSGNGVGSYPHFAVQMWNGSHKLADTSGTSNNGQTFTDYWHLCE